MSAQGPSHTAEETPAALISSTNDENKANPPVPESAAEKPILSKDNGNQADPHVREPVAASSTSARDDYHQAGPHVTESVPEISFPSGANENEEDVDLPDDDFGRPIDIDFDATENDSAYGDEIASYTTSIRSSIYDYPEEHGRRYHAFREGRYLLPNDEIEADRLDIHHELILTAMRGQLHLAPLSEDIQKALDLGTGTGIWALDFADLFPTAEVKACDLSPVQPEFVAPNVNFYVDDIEDDWDFEEDPLDYVHARFLAGAILNWPKLIQQAFKYLKPGAWAEFQEWDTRLYSADDSLTEDEQLYQYHKITCDSQEQHGYDMSPGKHLEGWFQEAGFVNVSVTKYILPLGTWPRDRHYKRVGAFNFLQMQNALEGIALATLTRWGKWSVEQVRELVDKTLPSLKDPRLHSQYDFYVVYGQKPHGTEHA